MSINTNISRIGNFTSSEIVALIKGGKTSQTYISECNIERRLLRSITDDVTARPLSWGNLVESRAFDSLGLEYSLNSQETILHPAIPYWSGSADGFKEDEGRTVIDIKCPMTLKSYCTFYDCKDISEAREKHKDGEKYYWQLVSNAIISDCRYAELIIYMPYQRELQHLRELAQDAPPELLYKFFWIANGNDEELPHLVEEGYYKNLKVIRFEVPDKDKEFLTNAVLGAGKSLIEFYKK
jgi:hypothetical protein